MIESVKVSYHPYADLKELAKHAFYRPANANAAIYTITVKLKELYCVGHPFQDDLNITHTAYDCQSGIFGANRERQLSFNSPTKTISLSDLEKSFSSLNLKTIFPVLSFDANLKMQTVLFGGP